MSKRAIFLDIDGVLNCRSTDPALKSRSSFDGGYHYGIDKVRVQRLARIVKATAADIILSSDWKDYWKPNHHYPPIATLEDWDGYPFPPGVIGRYLNNHLRKKGDGLKILDKTDDRGLWKNRGYGILRWLEAHPDYTSFVVIDDNWFNGFELLDDHLVLTDYQVGLTDEDVDKAIKILMKED